jgi:hypothetical protein
MDGAPDLFLLIEAPVLGEFGAGTDRQFDITCNVCGRRAPRFDRIELVLDRWKQQHLFNIYGQPIVSEDLRSAFADSGASGAAFQPVDKATLKGRSKQLLPGFHRLEVIGQAEGPDDWWEHVSTCEACGTEKLIPTKDGLRSENGPSSTGTGNDVVDPLPLRVYVDSWTGDDIFKLQRLSPTVVTKRFVDIARQVGVPGVHFRPTRFVRRTEEA